MDNPIIYQKFKCQIGNDEYDATCYVDLYCIESFEIEEKTILITLNSGQWKRVYSTEENFIRIMRAQSLAINKKHK